jgi:hypothetical protein
LNDLFSPVYFAPASDELSLPLESGKMIRIPKMTTIVFGSVATLETANHN